MSSDNEIKEIKLTTKITKKELYEFIMISNYKSLRGVLSILFSIVALMGTIYFWNSMSVFYRLIMIFLAMMFTVITPIEYYIRAGRQVKKNFKYPISYSFNEEGITISINEQSSLLLWEEVMKVISSKRLVMIYSSPIRAFIIPKKDIDDNFEKLRDMMEKNTDCYKFAMR